MDAVKYLKEKDRATNGCQSCSHCILKNHRQYSFMESFCIEDENPEEAVKIIEKWSKEHPRKTMLQDFLEKHPNAPLNDDGTPDVCPYRLGYTKETGCSYSINECFDCWSRPMEE